LFSNLEKHLLQAVDVVVDHVVLGEVGLEAVVDVVIHVLLDVADLKGVNTSL
jgi:hypothetical protein